MNWTMRTDPSGFQTRWSQQLADRYLREGHWTNTTLVDAARASLAADPDHLLLIEGENRLTRRQCWDKALKLAAFFLARGLKPGDVISFQLPNWVESAVIALAARMTGLGDRGRIAQGLRADLVAVRVVAGQPVVQAVWRQGKQVY